jgi:hypothetical protein
MLSENCSNKKYEAKHLCLLEPKLKGGGGLGGLAKVFGRGYLGWSANRWGGLFSCCIASLCQTLPPSTPYVPVGIGATPNSNKVDSLKI